jgi:UDP-glucose 4-epimerase
MAARPELTSTYAIVTGACGFLGRCVTQHLVTAGAQVHCLDVHESGIGLPDAVQYRKADITDAGEIFSVLGSLRVPPDCEAVVFHLAGKSHVGECKNDPRSAVTLNVIGTVNVLEACRNVQVKRLIFPSTALVYASPAIEPLSEDSRVCPTSVYAATKLAAEHLLQGYAAEYGVSCCIARLGNVYGHGARDSVVSVSCAKRYREGLFHSDL